MNKIQAKKILEKLEYPTTKYIIAFAIAYPNLFCSILKDKQVKKIINGDEQ